MTTLHGIDVSNYQHGLALGDAQFIIAKATEGTYYVDASCDAFVNEAKSAGKPWGVYHFASKAFNPTKEADYFLDHIKGYVGHGVLVLDWEGDAVYSGHENAKAWLDRVYDKTGVRPWIYMNLWTNQNYNWSDVSSHYGLWLAQYSSKMSTPSHWSTVAAWQYTDAHAIGGMKVDGDYFYGDAVAWNKYAGTTGGNDTDNTDDTGGGGGLSTADGFWGTDTTRLAQKVYGTTQDGEVSSQDSGWKSQNPGLTSGWEWVSSSAAKGSKLITAIQKEFGVSPADGKMGPGTIKAMEKHYGYQGDGHLDGPSNTIKKFQAALNKGAKR